MESNKNNNNNDGGDKHQQWRGSAQNRKSNKLANDEDKPAEATGEDQNCSSNKNLLEEGNDLDLELESLSREELIILVRKQMTVTMEVQKQFKTTNKEAGESVSRQAEEFSQRFQLEQEKAALHEELNKKLVEIVEMHKEVEEKSGELAEKAKQIDALLIQLNESPSHQPQMPTEQQMKIQLSLETWYDWLALVPRHQLGQIVPLIGDRKFASIVQPFLHEYSEITIEDIEIVAPFEDPSGHPRVRVRQNNRPLRFEMAETQMPANIKNFTKIELSYFDGSVLSFMQKFQQNGLLHNVNLEFGELSAKNIVQPVLCHLLPLTNGILSIEVENSAQVVDFYDAGNSKEIYELYIKMMEETKLLAVSYDPENLHATQIDLYCRWLYQTARPDGKPRMLVLGRLNVDYSPISLFIDRLKQDFLMATDLVKFFILIALPKAFQPLEDICVDNGKTKERLEIKIQEVEVQEEEEEGEKVVLLVSRHPIASTKHLTVENVKEAMNWDFGEGHDYGREIYMTDELKVVPI